MALATATAYGSGFLNYLPWYNIPVPPFLNLLIPPSLIVITFLVLKLQLVEIQVVVKKSSLLLLTMRVSSLFHFQPQFH